MDPKTGLKASGILLVLLYTAGSAHAQDIIDTVGGINNMLYGIAAGIAVLMITFHAIKWKTAGSPAEREEAKRGIINVILGLVIIILAASLVSMLYVVPPATNTTTVP